MTAQLAATNKHLARTNKSGTRARFTKNTETVAGAIHISHQPTRRGAGTGPATAVSTALFWRRQDPRVRLLQKSEHELAPFRAVFFPQPACRLRGVTGYYLRGHPEVFKKLPTQVQTRRDSTARAAFTYAPLAVGGDEQVFGVNQQVPHAGKCY